jgi:hypothetical protein
MRADGVVANHPADGRLDAGELVKFESGELGASLFPEEKLALPKLWKLLEAPSGNAVSMANIAPDLTPVEHRTEPGGLTGPTAVAISSLASELQTLAKRIELLANADGNATTIQVADVDHALANPGPFTPAEIEQLTLIKNAILSRLTSTEVAEVIMPRPGHTVTRGMIGSVAVEFSSDVTIREDRTAYRWERQGQDSFSANLQLEWTANSLVHTHQDDSLVLLELDTGKETVLTGSEVALPALAGSVVVERYVAGDRKETNLAAFPSFTPGNHAGDYNWSQYLDYDFVLADHTHLVKNVTSTNYESTYYHNSYDTQLHWSASFRWELDAKPSPGANHEDEVLAWVATPALGDLPPGRYAQLLDNGQTAYVDIYRPGVFFGRIGNDAARLDRRGLWFSMGFEHAGIDLDPRYKALRVSVDGVEKQYALSVAQRIK